MKNELKHLERLAAKKTGPWIVRWEGMDESQRDVVRGSLEFQMCMLNLSLLRLFRTIVRSLFSNTKQMVIVYWIAVAGLIAITIYALIIGYYFNALFLSGFMLYLAWRGK